MLCYTDIAYPVLIQIPHILAVWLRIVSQIGALA